MSDYVLSATLELKDRFTANVKKAQKSFRDYMQEVKRIDASVAGAESAMGHLGQSAMEAAAKTEKAKRSLQGFGGTRSATIRAKDEATTAVRKAQEQLNQFKGKTYTAFLNIKQGMAQGNTPLNQMKNGMTGMASGMLMGTSMQMAGAAGIGFGVYDAVKNYTDFTAQLSEIKALTGMSSTEMDAVKEKAMELGDATRFSTTEAAQGMTELLKAGVDVKDVLGNASEAALDLAAAGGLALPEAAEIMSTAMNAFHMDDATHAADILAGAANASATSVEELRYSLAAVSAVAAGAGMSFDDTNTALAVFAQNGLKGSDAGTSLKTMLSNLIPKGKTAIQAFQQLNLLTEDGSSAFFDEAGHMKSLADIAGLLQDRMKGMTDEEKMSALYDMFGSDAIRGGMILLREGADGVRDMADAMSQFTAKQVALEKMNNLKGALDELSSAWENLGISILTQGGGDGLRSFVDELTGLVRGFNEAIKDGFQLTDVLKTAGEGFKDLKDKALAMDGVGSVLAAGALVAGLTKIIGLARRAKNYLGDVAKAPSSAGPGTGGSSGGIGDMVVNARTVIVNGGSPSGQSGAPGGAGGSGKSPGRNDKPGAPPSAPQNRGIWNRLKNWSRLGLGLTIANGLFDVVMADEGQRGTAAGGVIGSTAGWLVGAKGGAALGAGIGSLFGGIGAVPGAAIGGFFGGVACSFAGGSIGQKLVGLDWYNEVAYAGKAFDAITQQFAAKNQEWVDAYAQTCEQLKAKGTDWETGIHQTLDSFASYMDTKTGEAKDVAVSCWDTIAQTAEEKNQEWAQSFERAKNIAGVALDGLRSWASGVWADISGGIDGVLSKVQSFAQEARNAQTIQVFGYDTGIANPLYHNATGSTHFAGGWTEINERGGELVRLPGGSTIYPHATTVKMLEQQFAGLGSAGAPQVTVTGNTFTVREEADIDRIAYAIARLIRQGAVNYGGAM